MIQQDTKLATPLPPSDLQYDTTSGTYASTTPAKRVVASSSEEEEEGGIEAEMKRMLLNELRKQRLRQQALRISIDDRLEEVRQLGR